MSALNLPFRSHLWDQIQNSPVWSKIFLDGEKNHAPLPFSYKITNVNQNVEVACLIFHLSCHSVEQMRVCLFVCVVPFNTAFLSHVPPFFLYSSNNLRAVILTLYRSLIPSSFVILILRLGCFSKMGENEEIDQTCQKKEFSFLAFL